MTQDLYYIEEGYYDTGYYVYTADAETAVAVSSTVACSADKFRSFNAVLNAYSAQFTTPNQVKSSTVNLSSAATQVAVGELLIGNPPIVFEASFSSVNTVIANASKTASGIAVLTSNFATLTTVSHIHGADLFAFNQAQLELQVSRLRDTNTQASAYFDIATGYIRYRNQSIDADAAFATSSQGQRIRASQVETQGAFFIDVAQLRIRSSSLSVQSNSTVDVTVNKIKQGSATLTAESTVNVNVNKTNTANISINSSSNLTASISLTKIVECYADDYFTQQTTSGAIRDYSIALTVLASANAIAVKTSRVISQHNSQSNQTANVVATYNPGSYLSTTSTVFAVLSGTRGVDIVVYGFASLTATANSAFKARAAITSQATVAANNTRLKFFKTNRPYVGDDYVAPGYAIEVPGVNSFGTLTANVETFVYVRGVGNFVSTAQQTTLTNYRVASTQATISSQANLVSIGKRTQRASASIGALFTPALTIDIFKNSFAVLDSQSTLSLIAKKYNSGRVQTTALVTITAFGGVRKQLTATPTLTIGLDATGNLVAGGVSSISSQSDVNATALRIQGLTSSISCQASAQATALRIKPFTAAITANSALALSISPVRNSIQLLASSGTITANSTVIRSAVIATNAIFTELVLATTQTIQPQINLYAAFALTVTPVATLRAISLEASAGTLTANANIIKATTVITASQATVTAQVKRIAKARATLQATATLSCQAQKKAEIAIVVNGFASLTVIGQTARLAIALAGSQATLNITVKRIRNNPAAITARATVQAKITYQIRPRLAFTTQTSLTAQIGAIHIDPYLTWIISSEDRSYDIRQETRNYAIGKDNRIYTVFNDKRKYTVKEETRIYTIRR
jgi:hypothetical protein